MLSEKFAKIGICWTFITFAGIYGFVLSKQSVDEKRIEAMRVRQRMRNSNIGEYQPSERSF